jgi:hypothetical protein
MEEDYPFIRKWGQLMGSRRSYVEDELQLARAEHAPANAIYRQGNSEWRTTDDVTNPKIRRALGLDEE